MDDKGAINIAKPKTWWMGASADGLGFKHLHEEIGYNGITGDTYGCVMALFIILTLEKEIPQLYVQY